MTHGALWWRARRPPAAGPGAGRPFAVLARSLAALAVSACGLLAVAAPGSLAASAPGPHATAATAAPAATARQAGAAGGRSLRGGRARAPKPRTSLAAMEPQFMCVTCNIPLSEARSPQAERERALLVGLVDQGLGEGQIRRAMRAEYGSAVLALPSSSGFGLVVYVVPPVVLALALIALALVLPRWRRRTGGEQASWGGEAADELTPAQEARLERDLARYGR